MWSLGLAFRCPEHGYSCASSLSLRLYLLIYDMGTLLLTFPGLGRSNGQWT